MRHLFRNTVLVVIVMIASASGISGVLAQDEEPAPEGADLISQVPGLESGVLRSYAVGADAAASPAIAGAASPVASDAGSGTSEVLAAILTFADDADALGGMTSLQRDLQGDSTATAVITDPVGDKRAAFLLEDEAGTITASTIIVQSGSDVVVVLIEGAGAEQDDLLVDLASAIVETDAGADAVQFSPDGTSTGGHWDRLPAADDALLGSLGVAPVEDVELQASQA